MSNEQPWVSFDNPEEVPDGAVWGTFKIYVEDDLMTESMGMYLYVEAERKLFVCHGKVATWVYSANDVGDGLNQFFGVGHYGRAPYNPPAFEDK